MTTPIVLMGYYNPIYTTAVERFLADAKAAGVDGLIIVDLPPEEDDELCVPAMEAGLNFIRLARLRRMKIVYRACSRIHPVLSTMFPITGSYRRCCSRTRQGCGIGRPYQGVDRFAGRVGFGVRTPEQAEAIGSAADGVVVGSAIVSAIADTLEEKGLATAGTVGAVGKPRSRIGCRR